MKFYFLLILTLATARATPQEKRWTLPATEGQGSPVTVTRVKAGDETIVAVQPARTNTCLDSRCGQATTDCLAHVGHCCALGCIFCPTPVLQCTVSCLNLLCCACPGFLREIGGKILGESSPGER